MLARRHDRVVADAGGQYVCPMHREVTASEPRECPICSMALVKKSLLGEGNAAAADQSSPGDTDDAVDAVQLLATAAGGVAPALVGYAPSPVRGHVLRQEPYAPAWLENGTFAAVLLYRDQLTALTPDERGSFSPTAEPTRSVDMHRAPEPPTPWDNSTSLVRFIVDGDARNLRPRAAGWVKFSTKPRESLVVPAMAVLQSEGGPYVLVFSSARGTFTKRPIEIGKVFSGFAAVVSGLRPRELVVSMNAFFWDAERRSRAEQRGDGGGSP
jgi:hypothetical protein